jgi:C4-dicarboxylate-specific signal transduction histidine kinase
LLLGVTLSSQLLVLIFLCFKVGKIHQSRSCAVLALAFFLALAMNVTRSINILLGNDHIPLLEFSLLSNTFVVGILLTTISYSFGYWGFFLEKTQAEKMAQALKAQQADEKRIASEAFAQELQHIIEQRDQMVLMASRFSATHSLAVFNTAIVHELSQPLQAIALSLETLQMKSRQQDAQVLESQIQNTLELTSKMGLTLGTLRQLVSTQKADLEVVNIKLLLHNTIPILQAESQRHGVSLTLSNLHPDACVIANKVLLERIIINLIANALDAIKAQSSRPTPATICVKAHSPSQASHPVWELVVSDSGPGIPQEIMASISQPFQSTKDTGLGVGLALANLMLRMWQGTLSVRNKTQEEGSGAEVSIQIPLQAANTDDVTRP